MTAPKDESVPSQSAPAAPTLFRSEALTHFRWRGAEGAVLKSTPRALRHAYDVVVGFVIAGLLFVSFGKLDHYSRGPSVIRVDGRIELTARDDGTVARVLVQPGKRVAKGALLVSLHAESEAGELARLEAEYDDRTRARLLDPRDESSRLAAVSLRAALELARRRLDERAIRAPADGVITDVRIRPGQRIERGDSLASLSGDDARVRVVAMLPASDRPRLRVGGPLRLELLGYRYAYRDATISAIGDEAVGPAEVQRYLGSELADTVQVTGPVILVEARLPTLTFRADGQTLRFVDGMPARVDASLRREPIAVMLLPALRLARGGEL